MLGAGRPFGAWLTHSHLTHTGHTNTDFLYLSRGSSSGSKIGHFWRQKVPILGYRPQTGQSRPFRNRLGLFFASGQSGTISLHSYFPELSKPVYSNRIQTILDQTDPSLRPSFRYPCIMENIRWIQNLEFWEIFWYSILKFSFCSFSLNFLD